MEPISSWEEDRKFVLRAWCLVFIILATVMLLSVLDGRMAYLHGAYTGYVGFWTNCKKHTCANLRQVTGQWGTGRALGRSMGWWSLEMISGKNLWRNLFGCSWLPGKSLGFLRGSLEIL